VSRLRITVVLEEVADTGDRVLSEQRYGAFAGKPGWWDVPQLAQTVARTVAEELPKFWKMQEGR
jgi:hypothetical protein